MNASPPTKDTTTPPSVRAERDLAHRDAVDREGLDREEPIGSDEVALDDATVAVRNERGRSDGKAGRWPGARLEPEERLPEARPNALMNTGHRVHPLQWVSTLE